MNALTSSEMAAWTNCHRGWYVNYYLQLRKTRDYSPLPAVGTMVHSGLESYYNGEDGDAILTSVRELGAQLLADYPEEEPRITKNVELAVIMLQGYVETVAEEGWDIGLTVVQPEMTVEFPLGATGFKLRGKIDTMLSRDSDDALLQLENKTVGNFTDLPKIAQASPQFLTYDLLAFLLAKEQGGRPTDGVLLNMLRRVKRTASAKPPFYMRYEVRHNEEELRNHYRHVVAIGKEIAEARKKLDKGYNHQDVIYPRVSRDHSWSCDCRELTPMYDDGSDVQGFLAEFYEPYDPLERYETHEEEAA